MSSLNKALSAANLAPSKAKGAYKTDMKLINDEGIASKVDQFLVLQDAVDNATASLKAVQQDIRNFAYSYVIRERETENLIIKGHNGEVNVNFKDQYTAISDEQRLDEIRAALSKKKIDPEQHIKEESKVEFDFNALTDGEKQSLIEFLSKTLGADRMQQVVTTKTQYKMIGLKDELIKKAKTVEEFTSLRSLVSAHDATVVRRVAGKG